MSGVSINTISRCNNGGMVKLPTLQRLAFHPKSGNGPKAGGLLRRICGLFARTVTLVPLRSFTLILNTIAIRNKSSSVMIPQAKQRLLDMMERLSDSDLRVVTAMVKQMIAERPPATTQPVPSEAEGKDTPCRPPFSVQAPPIRDQAWH